MRLLVRLEVELERIEHRVDAVHGPVLAAILEGCLRLPQLQDYVERLSCHLAILAAGPIDIEQSPVTRQSARPNAEHEASLCDVIEIGDPARKFRRMMIRQQMCAWLELHPTGAQQALRDEQVRRGIRRTPRTESLANPGLGEAGAVA